MNREDLIPSIVISSHALARIAAQEAGDEAASAQWRVLSILESRDGMRVGELARAARTTQPGMTRLIGDLERTGLVARADDPDDSRATLVTATDAGIAALRAWRKVFRDTLAPRFADLGEDDWAAVARTADILRAHSIENAHGVETTRERE